VDEILEIQTREARLLPRGRYFLVFLTIVGITLLLILAGGRSGSVIGVHCGTWEYFLITFMVSLAGRDMIFFCSNFKNYLLKKI
jgi:hypothetical protein